MDTPAKYNGTFKRYITVEPGYCDKDGNMTLSAMARVMQDSSVEYLHGLINTRGSSGIDGLLWMIIKTMLQMSQSPKLGDKLELRYWPGEEKYWMYPMRTVFLDEDGKALAEGASLWGLVDAEKREMVSPSEALGVLPYTQVAGELKLPKLSMPFPANLPRSAEHTVRENEIDWNEHVNNSFYLDWVAELISKERKGSHTPSSLWIEYSKELRLGQRAIMHYAIDNTALFLKGSIGKDDSFSVRVDFKA